MSEQINVAVIGAGAAGLMAAIEGGREARKRALPPQSVVAFDGASRIGAKILISGGGRCNVTHDEVHPCDFNGANENRVARVLRSFTVPETTAFFAELGVRLVREETGKLFPSTGRARDVVGALVAAAEDSGAQIRTSSRVTAVDADDAGFRLTIDGSEISARRVILATGGLSVPKTGSDGAGYRFASRLGHSLTPRFPALVPLLLDPDHWLLDLRGITLPAALELRSSTGRRLRRENGSLLFAHFGITGPLALDMSRHWLAAQREGTCTLVLSVLPDESVESVGSWLRSEAAAHPREHLASALSRRLPGRLAAAVAAHGAGSESASLGRLTREQRRSVATSLTELLLPVTGDRGFGVAEVTAGGVPLEELDTATMASKRHPGLYLCGEICDVDGRIGGYNFQWAWASGRLAGRSAVRSLVQELVA